MGVHPTVLLTGFGPFPGVEFNASARLVPALARLCRRRFGGVRFVGDVLETDWNAAPARLDELLDVWVPDVVIHFGVSSVAHGFVIEQVARNHCGSAVDVYGCAGPGGEVLPGGPSKLRATLPGELILARLVGVGIPARLSEDAGCYLCNAVSYRSLLACSTRMSSISGFIHIPQDLGLPACHLSWRDALAGGMAIVGACVERARKQG